MLHKVFDKKIGQRGTGISENQQLAQELPKPIIKKFKMPKVYPSYWDNIWGVDLADMQLLSKCNKGVRFLLCVIDTYSKYAWVILLKVTKGTRITIAFQKFLDESICQPNKMWVDQDSEFYNRSMNEVTVAMLKCIQHTTKENLLVHIYQNFKK